MPDVNHGSRYRRGESTSEQPVSHGRRKRQGPGIRSKRSGVHSQAKVAEPEPERQLRYDEAESLATLQGMCGCSERVAHWALWECKSDVERASNWILNSETMRSDYDVRPLPEEARGRQTPLPPALGNHSSRS